MIKQWKGLITVALAACLLVFGHQARAEVSGNDPVVTDAVSGVLAAFDHYPIVALGEQHGIRELGDFYQALLRDPRFAETVNAVVMEYGNALYQDLADRYVNGEDVPYTELRKSGRIPSAKFLGAPR
jgi:hypothetical protein